MLAALAEVAVGTALWVEPHTEKLTVAGSELSIHHQDQDRCRQQDGRNAWEIIDPRDEPIVFERDVV